MKLAGTYDVLTLPFLLDTEIVLDLLPISWRSTSTSTSTSPLLPIPADVLASLQLPQISQDQSGKPLQHLVLLQLGYQHGAGPGPYVTRFMMNFGEAKVDIPYLRHPALQGKSGLEDKPFSLKQIVIAPAFLAFSSKYIAGIRSASGSFDPSRSPSCFSPDSETLRYEVGGYLEANLKRSKNNQSQPEWGTVQKLIESPWFGENMGEYAVKFAFDVENALIPPTSYDFDLSIHIDRLFAGPDASSHGPQPLSITGRAFRFKANWTTPVEAKVSSDKF